MIIDCLLDSRRAFSHRLAMHPEMFRAFDALCNRRGAGGSVLEVGAVPSDDTLPADSRIRRLARIPGFNHCLGVSQEGLRVSTLTFQVHNHPGDYYRFSQQAVCEILCVGLRDVEVDTLMVPPRVIGSGILA